MTAPDPDEHARRLATEALADADPTGWFERLYAAASDGEVAVPWDRGHAHPLLVEWAETHRPAGRGRRALVVGSGLGDDAEYVAGLGFDTTAFDISATAIRTARSRYPDSAVDYGTADLLDPPPAWRHAFDLVVESLTIQSLPVAAHPVATAQVGRFVAPGGALLVIAFGRAEGESVDGPPWPLTRSEVEAFASDGLAAHRIEELRDPSQPGILRWRAEFRR